MVNRLQKWSFFINTPAFHNSAYILRSVQIIPWNIIGCVLQSYSGILIFILGLINRWKIPFLGKKNQVPMTITFHALPISTRWIGLEMFCWCVVQFLPSGSMKCKNVVFYKPKKLLSNNYRTLFNLIESSFEIWILGCQMYKKV